MTRGMGSGRHHSVCSDAYPVFTRYSTNIYNKIWRGPVHVLVSNFLGYVFTKNWQNRMKSDKDVTKIKRVTFFLWRSVEEDSSNGRIGQRSYFGAVPDRIDDSDVTVERHEQNSVRRRKQRHPQRGSSQPHATDEPIVDAVAGHTSAVHIHNKVDAGRNHQSGGLVSQKGQTKRDRVLPMTYEYRLPPRRPSAVWRMTPSCQLRTGSLSLCSSSEQIRSPYTRQC